MIQRTAPLASAITRNRNLSVEELKSLNLPLIFQGDTRHNRKKHRRLETQKTHHHTTQQNLSSPRKRTRRLHHTLMPKRTAKHNPIHLRIQKHAKNGTPLPTTLLSITRQLPNVHNQSQKIRRMVRPQPRRNHPRRQTRRRNPRPHKSTKPLRILKRLPSPTPRLRPSPGAVSNYIKAVKTFYRANGVKKVELDEPLSRKVTYKDRAPKPEEIALMPRQSRYTGSLHRCSYRFRRLPRRNLCKTQIPTRQRRPRSRTNTYPHPR